MRFLCLVLLLSGGTFGQCEEPAGFWNAGLDCPGGTIRFGIDLQKVDTRWTAHLINGIERIAVPEVVVAEDSVILKMAHYDSELRLKYNQNRLSGTWKKRRGADEWLEMRASASLTNDSKRATTNPTNAHEAYLGRWDVKFQSSAERAVGIFRQRDDRVQGTFLTTTGDYRYLDGQVRDGSLELSCFDGGHAFLFRADLTEDGRLAGDFWSSSTWHETWTAERNPDARLPDSFTRTTNVLPAAPDELKFPGLDGVPTSINDKRFAGKARIIYVFGSWCPNCHDAASYFAELEKRYGTQELSILGLAFELTGEFERDKRQVELYSKRHGTSYPILIAGMSDKKEASKVFPLLDRIRSYPTTIFLDGQNQVHAVHTGFSGPATGEDYVRLKKRFEEIIQTLISKSP